jgi:endogenous inhibitor of DNA gyrase (YacG/DUF329 family)
MSDKIDKVSCPNCGKKGTFTPSNEFRPFCSDRCRLIDLGDWASEKHRVAGDPVDLNKLDDESEKE